jgi:VCBS repeat-containing protein
MIQSDVLATLATEATSLSAGSYHFGVPQFADITLPQVPLSETYHVDASAALPPVPTLFGNVVIPNITSATADASQGTLQFTIANPNPGKFAGSIVIRALFADGTYRDIETLDGNVSGQITVTPPAGLAVGSSRWELVRKVSTQTLTSSGELNNSAPLEFEGNNVSIAPLPNMAAVLTRTGIEFVRENTVVSDINLVDLLGTPNNFNGTYLTGNKVQPTVFSSDLSRCYVAGNGAVYVIDMVTFKLINTIAISAGQNIVSLATVGDLLFIGEGQSYGASTGHYRILVMDIDPGSKTYNQVVTLQGTGIESSTFGVTGMTIGPDGKTLVVGVPRNANSVMLGDPTKRGDVWVFDLSTLNYLTGKIAPPVVASLPGDGLSGKAPQVISATSDPNDYLIADVEDYDRGLSTLVIRRDAQGNIVSASMSAIDMSQPTNAIINDRTNVQRAQSAVLVTVDGVEYAIVADDNYNFNDPYWKAMFEAPDYEFLSPDGPPTAIGGSSDAKKVNVGGKLGIVKDPFGLSGTPQYLGSTLPLDGYGIVNLSLSDDGNVLLGQLKGGFGTINPDQQNPNQNHVWDVHALIKAALNTSDQDRQSKHIPLPTDAEQLIPTPGGSSTGAPIGTAFDPPPDVVNVTGQMGDITKIDLKKLAACTLLGYDPNAITAAQQINLNALMAVMTDFSFDAGQLDRYTAAADRGISIVTEGQGANRAVISSNGSAFAQSGVFYVAPNITSAYENALRLGTVGMGANGTASGSTGSLQLSYTLSAAAAGISAGAKHVKVNVTATDVANVAVSAFIGDRDANRAGYTDMQLSAPAITLTEGTTPNSAQNALEMWEIEQRLRYLGFLGAPDETGTTDYQVGDRITKADMQALDLFAQVVTYPGDSTNYKYQTSMTVDQNILGWLNAYNAPHWMQLFASDPNNAGHYLASNTLLLPNWTNLVTGGDKGNAVFGTSWMIDLMRAAANNRTTMNGTTQAPSAPLQFNGAANADLSNGNLGMTLNLGINQNYISTGNQDKVDTHDKITGVTNPTPSVTTDADASSNGTPPSAVTNSTDYNNKQWDYSNAVGLSGLLTNPNIDNASGTNLSNDQGANDQRSALRDLLAFFNAVNSDPNAPGGGNAGDGNQGSYNSLQISSAHGDVDAIRNALFGGGTTANSIINSVYVGGTYQTAAEIKSNNATTGLGFGAMLSATTLAKAVGLNPNARNYGAEFANLQSWIKPLTEQMIAYHINTPDDITAFLAELTAETHFHSTAESFIYQNGTGGNANTPAYKKTTAYKLSSLFSPAFSPARHPNWTQTVDAYNGTKTPLTAGMHAAGYGFLNDTVPQGVTVSAAWQNALAWYNDVLVPLLYPNGNTNGPATWSEAAQAKIANRVYSSDVTYTGLNFLNGGVEQADPDIGGAIDGYSYRGEGVLQVTGKDAISKFLNYVYNTNHRPLGVPDRSALDTPDAEGYPTYALLSTNKTLSVALAGYYWDVYKQDSHGNSMHTLANSANQTSEISAVSSAINADSSFVAPRNAIWDNFYKVIFQGGNSYENMNDTLGRLGIQSTNMTGYQHQLGINMKPPTRVSLTTIAGGAHQDASQSSGTPASSPTDAAAVLADVNQLLPQAPDYWATNGAAHAVNGTVTVNLADLPTGQLGQTQGTIISLSSNASGLGWYVNGVSNDDFLPTSDPGVWVAKPGSAAEGKYDLLTVVLHEYGHALGLSDIADSANDIMSTTLQPGVRRLPAGLSLQTLQSLIATKLALAAGSSANSGSVIVVTAPTAFSQSTQSATRFDTAANPTLTNGDFTSTAAWATTGDVTIGSGSATLSESTTTQTRMNQVFVVGATDRFLRFTLTDADLQNPGNGPQDAFEVALLDASTGQSLEAPIALSNTDDFLNLQGDGSSFQSSGVTSFANADGSRTYLVDLRGIAAGTAVNLSFDLIGFGAKGSQVTVRDLHVGLPETFDDAVTSAEDTSVSIAALANDVAANQPGFVPVVVNGPAHGQVTVNADGTFGYTPDKDYNGTDSFTYKLSDGQLDSNVSTVSLTITPVNDPPVAGDVVQNTLEDAPLVIDLLAHAYDVDSPTLTPRIVDGPAHGQVTTNADGTYTYTPDANFNGTDSFSYLVNDGELDSNLATVQIGVTSVNDAPTGTSTTVTTLEDTPYTFNVGDFGFSDASDTPANTFAAVILGDLPQAGSLALNGLAVVAGQRITVADITAGLLRFAPDANANGAGYAQFTFAVQDDGGTANGGVDRDVVAKTMTLNVTSVNDAPSGTSTTVTTLEDTPYVFNVGDFGFSDASDTPANVFAAVILGDLPQDGSLALNGQAVVAGQRITVADITAGLLQFAPAPNANGDNYAGFTFQVQDDGGTAHGGVDTDPTARTLTLNVTPVNDPPVAASAEVSGLEDTAYVFGWKDFPVSDIDSTSLSIILATLPEDGQLQSFDGSTWTAVTVNQQFSQADIDAGKLRFVPAANASGFSGFATPGTGNLKQHYARFDYQAFDGELSSDTASMFVDITPVADAPTLALTDVPGERHELFRTDWESVDNRSPTSTLVHSTTLEGWTDITQPDPSHGGWNGFEVWSDGDRMVGPKGPPQEVHAATNGGHNWIELNDAQGEGHQTLGIERSVNTVAGATYTLSLDYAGRPGYNADYTAIGIYVDGVLLASYANTSPADALNWQALQYSFTGTGGAQSIRIVTLATQRDANGRGAMIDNIALSETLPSNTGLEDTAIPLSQVRAALTDTDGSEVLAVAITALPVGATVSDGTHSFTATADAIQVDVTGWNLATLTLLPPLNFNGQITLGVEATSTESSNGSTASTKATLAVMVIPVNDAPVAHDDSVTVRTLKTVVIDVLANDTDVDSTHLTSVLVDGPEHGWLTHNSDGTFSYTAACGYVGTDSFTYRANDGQLDSPLATVTITVTANHPPMAKDDAVTTAEDTPVKIDVLANDTDADGDVLKAYVVDGPEHGRLCRHDDGTWTYLADANWSGTDTFTYRAYDDLDGSSLAKVTITVTPVSDAPTARNASFGVQRDGSVRIDFDDLVADVDGDALTLSLTDPAHGTLSRNDDGSYTYRAASGFIGTDAFAYAVSDGTLSATAAITLNVGHDDDDDCGYQATVMVQSGPQVFDKVSNGYSGYIVVSRGISSARPPTDPRQIPSPELDWQAQADSSNHGAGHTGGEWWSSLFDEPLVSMDDLARQSGLIVKKPH